MKKMKSFLLISLSLLLTLMFFTACEDDGTTLTDAESVTSAVDALDSGDITFSGSDTPSSVTGDFNLPTTGENNTTITWAEKTDSGENIVLSGTGNSTAAVTWSESNGFGPNTLILTATVTKGIESTTKDISVTVYPSATTKIETTDLSVNFKMVLVPGGLSLKINDGDFSNGLDDATASIVNAYWIGETEVTYELWNAVYTWATDNSIDHDGNGTAGDDTYTFANPGRQGGDPETGPVGTNQHPVTTINWREAMVWCNALTEYYNAYNGTDHDLDLVYFTDENYITPLRITTDTESVNSSVGSEDKPYLKADATGNIDMANCTAKGFRLLTLAEWSCAARYKGSDSSNGAFEYPADSGWRWTPGNYASGDSAPYDTSSTIGNYAVYNTSSTAVVKSLDADSVNALGLFDMSGNVWEYNFDWFQKYPGYARVIRGGYYSDSSGGSMRVGYWSFSSPFNKGDNIGFRFARTQ